MTKHFKGSAGGVAGHAVNNVTECLNVAIVVATYLTAVVEGGK